MPQNTGPWIAQLIRAHQAQLAIDLATATRREVPFYANWEPAQLAQGISGYFGVLADVFAGGDVALMRAYMERVTAARIRQGAGGMDYIWMLNQGEAGVRALIEAAQPDPRCDDALRQLRTTHGTIGLIISEINLRALQAPGPNAPET